MSDITTPISPKTAIVLSLEDRAGRILIDKSKTDVVYVEPYHVRNNTRAYINEYDTAAKVNIVRNHREVLYDRVDLNELMEEIATLTPDSNDQLCHVIHNASVERTAINMDGAAFCELLNEQYDLPVLETDFDTTEVQKITTVSGSLGDTYARVNCTVTPAEIVYTNSNITHIDGDRTVTEPGVAVVREWVQGESITFLPNLSTSAAGWTIELGFGNDADYTASVHTNLKLAQNTKTQLWDVWYNGAVVTTFDTDIDSGVTIAIDTNKVVITVIGGEAITLDTPGMYYNRGVARILAYTNNPYPASYKLGFVIGVAGTVTGTPLPNSKNYAPTYNLINATASSNATVGKLRYPINVSRYKTLNYIEREEATFEAIQKDTHGRLEVFVQPVGYEEQKVTFTLTYPGETLPKDTVESVLLTITDVRNVNNKLYVKVIRLDSNKTLVGKGPSLSSLVYETNDAVTDSEVYSVTIGAGDIAINENDLVLANHHAASEVSSTDLSTYKVDFDVKVKPKSLLPDVLVTYDPTAASNV